MRCPGCGNYIRSDLTPDEIRCLDCGTLLTSQDSLVLNNWLPNKKHSYNTPIGKFVAKVQPMGTWAGSYQFFVGEEHRAIFIKFGGELGDSLKGINDPALGSLRSFDAEKLRFIWIWPNSKNLVPLSSLSQPLAPNTARDLLERLGMALQRLHEKGLAAFDLAPEMIFVDLEEGKLVLIPSPWLSFLARYNTDQISIMPFVAPELEDTATRPNPNQTDIYALGMLSWFLLAGKQHQEVPRVLPSECFPELKVWDVYIDGCCRTNPARRFESVADALKNLRTANRQSESSSLSNFAISGMSKSQLGTARRDGDIEIETDTKTSSHVRAAAKSRRFMFTISGAVIALVLVFYVRREQIASKLPLLGNFLSSYERGFGDTILKYADRTYEGASWSLLKEAGSLSTLGSHGGYYLSGFTAVTGWDENNFWLLDEEGPVYQFRNGHWELRADLAGDHYYTMRLLDRETVLCASKYNARIYRISSNGVTKLGDGVEIYEIATVSDDLHYFFGGRRHCAKFVSGKFTKLSPDKHKEAFVHRRDNTPLKQDLVGEIRFAHTLTQGDAVGVVDFPVKIVRFENGTWYEVGDEFEELRLWGLRKVKDVWFGPDLSFAVFVGIDGLVLFDEIGRTRVDQSITATEEPTSSDLIAVWGVSPDRYWVMDDSGTVWERTDGRWRTVVRGFYEDDIEFNDAWVSPTGTIIAITDDKVYRLE